MAVNLDEFINELLGESVNPSMVLPDPTLVQYYENLQNRTIWITDEINEELFDVISKIVKWNRDDKEVPVKDRKPIKIFFNSPGGSLDVEETLVQIIKISRTPIYGFAIGMVASAASLIYLSCHRRFALPNAYLIFHQGSCSNMSGSYAEIQAAMADYTKTVERMTKFYIENTSFSEEEVREKIKNDWYIYIDEAIKKNIVTDLIQTIDVMF